MRPGLEALRRDLLAHGLTDGRVGRLLRELDDHLSDAEDALAARGVGAEAARTRAWRDLGGEGPLAGTLLRQLAARSWAGRHPRTSAGLLAWAALILLLGLAVELAAHGAPLLRTLVDHGVAVDPPRWAPRLQGAFAVWMALAPPLAAALVCAYGRRRDLGLAWGLRAALWLGGLAWLLNGQLTVQPSADPGRFFKGSLSFGLGLIAGNPLPHAIRLLGPAAVWALAFRNALRARWSRHA